MNVHAECGCGHARGYHLFGFGRCTACTPCWWFHAKRLPYMLVRYACGCSSYRDSKLALDDVRCPRPEHAGARGVEIVP